MRLKKFPILILIISMALFAITGCSTDKSGDPADAEAANQSDAEAVMPAVSNMAGNQTSAEVCNDLNAAGLSNVVTFYDWILDFAGSAGDAAGLSDKWDKPGANTPDLAACANGWEKHHDYSDTDCRMTAMLLLDGILTAEKTDSEYTGTYLMFDIDAIENADRYEVIKKNLDLFTTLFGDRTPVDGEDPSGVFGDIWNEYGFSIANENVSLVSIVVYDPDFKQTFTGHTGVLIKKAENDYLFVEKLAFEQPYQAIRVNSTDQLFGLLAGRDEYFGSEGEAGPYVYLNGDYLGELGTWK